MLRFSLLLLLATSFFLQTAIAQEDKTLHGLIETGTVVRLSPESVKSLGIETAAVQAVDMCFVVEVPGRVLKRNELSHRVNSPITGRVAEILEDVGNHVVENQALLTVRSPEVEECEGELLQSFLQVDETQKAQVLQLNSQIEQEQAQLDLAKDNYDRVSSLLQDKIASRAEYETAKTDYDKAVIELQTLKDKQSRDAALASERLSLATEPKKQKLRLLGVSDLALTRLMVTRQIDPVVAVTANTDGEIIKRDILQGEIVDPSRVLFVIKDSQNYSVEAHLTQTQVSQVNTGLPVVLFVPGHESEKYFGKLRYVGDDFVDGNLFRIRANFRNTNNALKEGDNVRMRILSSNRYVMAVPPEAIHKNGGTDIVYVMRTDGEFEQRGVHVGPKVNSSVEILAGLRLGELVVIKGSSALHGEACKIQH